MPLSPLYTAPIGQPKPQSLTQSFASNPSAVNPVVKSPAAQTYIQNQATPGNLLMTPEDRKNIGNNRGNLLLTPTDRNNLNPSQLNNGSNNSDQISSIQAQLADKQAQLGALQSNHFTDTNQLQQTGTNQYGPSPYEGAKADYTKAYTDYINTLKSSSTPSSAVTNAQKQITDDQTAYNNYLANQQGGIAAIQGRDAQNAGIPLSIVKGQQRVLLDETTPTLNRLQGQVGIDQGVLTNAQEQQMQQNAANANAGLVGISLQEKLLGMQQSPAQQAAAKQLADKSAADLANTQANTAKTQAEISIIPTTIAKNKADIAKINSDIAKSLSDNTVLSIKDAQALGVPYGTTKSQAIASGKVPGVSANASELKNTAYTSAQALLEKVNKKGGIMGNTAVGGDIINRLGPIGDWLGQGTSRADFIVQFDNLKSLLSLDNVKYLKGQGQVSDAERKLLEQASAKLNRSQSESEFNFALKDIVTALSGETGNNEEQQLKDAGYSDEQIQALKNAQ